jgi:hypothetical protein
VTFGGARREPFPVSGYGLLEFSLDLATDLILVETHTMGATANQVCFARVGREGTGRDSHSEIMNRRRSENREGERQVALRLQDAEVLQPCPAGQPG